MTISEVYPHLKKVAELYKLNLSLFNEFKLAKLILVSQYSRDLI